MIPEAANGKIATMDQRDTMASSITIRGDRIVAVGTSPGIPKRDGCATLIDLKGRRAIPGLIDSHNHIVVVSLRPGRDQPPQALFHLVRQRVVSRAHVGKLRLASDGRNAAGVQQ